MLSCAEIFCITVALLITCFIELSVVSDASSFSIDLTHTDSPESPLFNPQNTLEHRLHNALASSFSPSHFEEVYLAKLSIGTPPRTLFLQIDTGSDLVWTQCLPCENCYHQVYPIYDPSKSTSYRDIPCKSDQCQIIETGTCTTNPNICNYTYGYASSLTQGILGLETFGISSDSKQSVSIPNIVFGCGRNSTAFAEHVMGLLGIGGGPASFVSQVSSLVGGRKFSQCIVPILTNPNITSKLIFGRGSEVEGDGVISTPLVRKADPTPYFVTLSGISVNDTFVPFSRTSSQNLTKGNMFIDNGTFPMLLPKELLRRLIEAIKNAIPLNPSEGTADKLCYANGDTKFDAPPLTMHFDGGANVTLTRVNTFAEVDKGTYCFVANPVDWEIGLYGSIAQVNFHMGFDLEKGVVSFKPEDCAKKT